jgi:putative photosynthetic complex assembly protein
MTERQVAPKQRPTRVLFPRAILLAFGVLIGASLAGVFGARLLMPAGGAAVGAAIVETRSLRFIDQPDGSIVVRAVADGRQVGVIAAGEDGFVRSTLRGLNRERKRFGTDMTAPLDLVHRADGSLVVTDPTTGFSVDLGAFGPSNVASFAAFMTSADGTTASGKLVPGSAS